jgi:hypothetical protein
LWAGARRASPAALLFSPFFLPGRIRLISATFDLAFQLPEVRPLGKPMAFTAAQMQRLIAWGDTRTGSKPPLLQVVLERVEAIRGSAITWAFGLSLGDLVTWSVKMARGSVSSLAAPLTFFKREHSLWIPKIVIRVCPELLIEADEVSAYFATCRRASIEFLNITDEHIHDGYLDRKSFKRAFNGAFFCDPAVNGTIFCPTLRDWGFYSCN